MLKPLLSIIIVSYNTSKLTTNCIKSIFKDKFLEFDLSSASDNQKIPSEIIVVDNNSSDDSTHSIKHLSKIYPKGSIKLLLNKKNYGYGKANNLGVANSAGKYLLLLNSDTIVLHSSISQTVFWLASHPSASACTAQLLNSDLTIQPSGGFFPNILNVFTWSLFIDDLPFVNKIIQPLHPHSPQFYTKDSFYQTNHPQDWITGAYVLIKRNLFDSIKGFDEKFFMYGEEIELFLRLKKKYPTKKPWYLVGPQIIHLGGASSPDKSLSVTKEYEGIMYIFKKHHPPIALLLVKLLLIINSYARQILYLLKRSQQKDIYSNIWKLVSKY